MAEVQGVVEAVSEKTGKTGKRVWRNVSLNVNGNWYGGFESDDNKAILGKVGKGDTVKLEYTENGNFKNFTKIELVEGVKQPASVPKGATRDVVTNNRDFRITYAGSRNTAIAFVELLVKNGGLTLPTKKSEIEDALLKYVDELTMEFAMKAWNAEPSETKSATNVVVGQEANEYTE